jgi:hypothetical protein
LANKGGLRKVEGVESGEEVEGELKDVKLALTASAASTPSTFNFQLEFSNGSIVTSLLE